MNSQAVKIKNYSGKTLQERELENHFTVKNLKKFLRSE